VVPQPRRGDHGEAEDEREVVVVVVLQGRPELGGRVSDRHRQVEREQGDGDRHHRVREEQHAFDGARLRSVVVYHGPTKRGSEQLTSFSPAS
jgi:hypothetical protein